MSWAVGFEGLGTDEVHAIGCAGVGDDDEASDLAGVGSVAALGGDEIICLVGDLELYVVTEDIGVLGKDVGELSDALFPRGTIEVERGGWQRLRSLRLLA